MLSPLVMLVTTILLLLLILLLLPLDLLLVPVLSSSSPSSSCDRVEVSRGICIWFRHEEFMRDRCQTGV